MTFSSNLLPKQMSPIYPLCNVAVPLERAKTDENGRAVHEDCYVLALKPLLERGSDPRD